MDNPSVEYMKLNSEKLGYILVSSNEINDLKTAIDQPTEKYLEEKANKLGLHVMSIKEYQSLNEKATETK